MAFNEFFRGRRVLVTGDTGFKGSWLSFWLKQLGAEVHGLALDPETDPSNYELLGLDREIAHRRVDIREFGALREALSVIRPEIVFHLAAQAIVRASYEQPVETLDANVMGTAHLLQSIREAGFSADSPCTLILITSDKCYENRESWDAYRETDPMGGHDPYSMSKGAAELVISAWRRSFFPPHACSSHGVSVASVRAGNVIGGGDWGPDRIVVDSVKALASGETVGVRNPHAVRPWQHVLEPLSGYLWLAAEIGEAGGERPELRSGFNFGPGRDSERSVRELVEALIKSWGSGSWRQVEKERFSGLHEATYLKLATDKAYHLLRWKPAWNFQTAVHETVAWYRHAYSGGFDTDAMRLFTRTQIESYTTAAASQGLRWASRA